MRTFRQTVLDNKIITRSTNKLFTGITMSPESIISIPLNPKNEYWTAVHLQNCTNFEGLTFQLNGPFASGVYGILRQPSNCSFSTPKFIVPSCVSISGTSVTEYGIFRITLTQTCNGMFSLIDQRMTVLFVLESQFS